MYHYNGYLIPLEFWRDIYPTFPVKEYYMISNHGRVYSKKSNKLLSIQITDNGYGYVELRTLDNKYVYYFIHRLVMACFHPIPNFDLFQVNHKNGDKMENYDENLEWCTGKENMEHASANGLLEYGERHHKSVLTNDQVMFISSQLMMSIPYSEIENNFVKEYGYIPNNFTNLVYRIHKKDRWGYITSDFTFPEYINKSNPISKEEAKIICECIDNGIKSYNTILEKCGYDLSSLPKNRIDSLKSTISSIKKGRTFKDVSSDFNFIKVQRLSSEEE